MVQKILSRLLLLASLLLAPTTWAEEPEDALRNRALIQIMPLLLHFEKSLKPASDQKYNLVLLNQNPEDSQQEAFTLILNEKLQQTPALTGFTIEEKSLNWLTQEQEPNRVIYLTHRLKTDEMHHLIALAKNNHWALFSPFDGDVERGITFGLMITHKVSPYVNLTSVFETGLALQATLFPVVKIYEEGLGTPPLPR